MSADGQRAVSRLFDTTVRVWDLESGGHVGPDPHARLYQDTQDRCGVWQ